MKPATPRGRKPRKGKRGAPSLSPAGHRQTGNFDLNPPSSLDETSSQNVEDTTDNEPTVIETTLSNKKETNSYQTSFETRDNKNESIDDVESLSSIETKNSEAKTNPDILSNRSRNSQTKDKNPSLLLKYPVIMEDIGDSTASVKYRSLGPATNVTIWKKNNWWHLITKTTVSQ